MYYALKLDSAQICSRPEIILQVIVELSAGSGHQTKRMMLIMR